MGGEGLLTVSVLTPFFTPAFRGGGPIRTIEALLSEHSNSHRFTIFSSDLDLGIVQPLNVPTDRFLERDTHKMFYIHWNSLSSRVAAIRRIREEESEFLYLNSFFSFWFSILPLILCRVGVLHPKTVVIAPRGEFGAGALRTSHVRKSIFVRVSRLLGLYAGVHWHASSETEREEIQAVFPLAKVSIRPNEVSLPLEAMPPISSPDANLHAVYIGRLSAKKGLDIALEALTNVRSNVRFDIYGEFEDRAYKSRVLSIVEALPDNVVVAFHGALEHSLVRQTFAGGDVFFFPTLHENFGHTIAESLSASCPVVIPDTTPFTQVVRSGGGLIVNSNSKSSWVEAIERFAGLTPHERSQRRNAAGKAYADWRAGRLAPSIFEMIDVSP